MSFQQECIFCQIAQRKLPAYVVHEDDLHVAFLSIYPISPAVTVVIPKEHFSSDVLSLSIETYTQLLSCARAVAFDLQLALGVKRVALIAEGMMIDHAHIKLYPLIVNEKTPKFGEVVVGDFHSEYLGYLTTLEGPRCSDTQLMEWHHAIKSSQKKLGNQK